MLLLSSSILGLIFVINSTGNEISDESVVGLSDVRIVDADTFEYGTPPKKYRLIDCNFPEKYRPKCKREYRKSIQSEEYVREKMESGFLIVPKRDDNNGPVRGYYGRILANLYVKNSDDEYEELCGLANREIPELTEMLPRKKERINWCK